MASIRDGTGTIMDGLSDVLVHAIVQFANENNSPMVAKKILQETAVFFDIEYFSDQISKGEWESVECYLMKYTKPEDNEKSMNIFFLLRKQKLLEVLAKNNVEEALKVMENEMQIFKNSHKKPLENISTVFKKKKPRDSKMVGKISDIEASRTKLADEVLALIKENIKFHGKLEFPVMEKGRLLKIIMQGLDWQHAQCKNPKEFPKISSLYVNHSCNQPDDAPGSSSVPNRTAGNIQPLETNQESVPEVISSQIPAQRPPEPLAPLRKSKPVSEALSKNKTAWPKKSNSARGKSEDRTAPTVNRKSLASKSTDQTVPTLKRKSPNKNQNEKSRHVSKKKRVEEASDPQTNDIVQQAPNSQQNGSLTDDLQFDFVLSLPRNTRVETMDFHPLHETLLLFGTNNGDIFLWELRGKKKLAQDGFRIWDLPTINKLDKNETSAIEIQRVRWSADGNYIAAAYANSIVHIYNYLGNGEMEECKEFVAHKGNTFDVVFTTQGNELWVVTCGTDNSVKVRESLTGASRHNFNCFKEPVCSVYPHRFNDLPAIYAADISGTVTVLLYNDKKPKLRIPLPNQVSAKFAFSGAEGHPRLFVGGTSDDDISSILELSQTGGSKFKNAYNGLVSPSGGYVNFDTVKGKYLVAVDGRKIKFWEMDNKKLLKTIDVVDGLKEDSTIVFNKQGSLFAVTAKEKCIKILANAAGKRALQQKRKCPMSAPKTPASKQTPSMRLIDPHPEKIAPRRSTSSLPVIRNNFGSSSRIVDEPMDLSEISGLNEINDFSQCISTRIPSNFTAESVHVSWLSYTKAGRAILVLGSKGEHKLLEWQKTDTNPSGKATAKSEPIFWQPPNGMQMINDVGYANPEGRVSCFCIPKNRHYMLSTSGGIVSVYDIKTFKMIAKVMPPPPVATALAIDPNDSNTLVIGMEDSSIHIYKFQTKKVSSVLQGHTKRVTGLAFSEVLNVLVSSGADSKLCIWSIDEWENQGDTILNVPTGRTSDTRIQFHKDQECLLAVHKTQIAIYTAPSLVCINQWVPEDAFSLITHAVYSCDCESIFVAFQDGSVGVFTSSSLDPKCHINPTSFLPPSHPMPPPFPLAVAAHPLEPNQFALGLSDGSVVVLEPKEETWEISRPDQLEDGAGPSFSPGIVDLDQLVWVSEDEEDT